MYPYELCALLNNLAWILQDQELRGCSLVGTVINDSLCWGSGGLGLQCSCAHLGLGSMSLGSGSANKGLWALGRSPHLPGFQIYPPEKWMRLENTISTILTSVKWQYVYHQELRYISFLQIPIDDYEKPLKLWINPQLQKINPCFTKEFLEKVRL